MQSYAIAAPYGNADFITVVSRDRQISDDLIQICRIPVKTRQRRFRSISAYILIAGNGSDCAGYGRCLKLAG